ncbi:MAG TPA: efflux transporter periplasmic adaptor subunit [Alteromonas macleodii]|nr:efflux RND transporter periplasmic adaptor subunit [Alteromonas macleodii]HBI77471.1 efflux transporter periplasmic adaptor subunit [Alteromonas macleodii]
MNKTVLAVFIASYVGAAPSFAQESDQKHAHNETVTRIDKSIQDKHDEHTDDGHEEHELQDGQKHDEHGGEGADEHDDHESEHAHDKGESENKDDEEHDESASASLDSNQMALANIKVSTLSPKIVNYTLYAPGEIFSNGYSSYRVSPRVASVVTRRHVALGDRVNKGQVLVTLFSETVAQAQANYRTTYPEWERVKGLGRKTVGEQRYIDAKANFEAASAVLISYGLSDADLKTLTSQQSIALGEYSLRAEIDGAVLSDSFEQGQRIDAGEPLISLADESELWVEAHLPSNINLRLGAGSPAQIKVGDFTVDATVTQEAHTIDPITRTRTVRLLVSNPEHRLHPGQFAEVYFRFLTKMPVMAVSESALMRGPDGDWMVFVEDHPGEFLPVEVELGRALGGLREITGVEPGSRVVSEGAFFVASQIAKGGFDPHNH